ncbi:FAD-dependent oxidoreductase [Streptomyces sp. NPDC059627]
MTRDYDVIVVGGGSAGVGAADAGARTLLIERGSSLGGAATLRNVLTYCGLYNSDQRQVVYGVAERVLTELRAVNGVSAQVSAPVHGPVEGSVTFVTVDPEAVKRSLDTVCARAGVEVLLYSTVFDAERDGDRIASVAVAEPGGIARYTARVFVDASGEASLAAAAGALIRYGNDGRVQTGTLGLRFGGVPASADVSVNAVEAAVTDAVGRGIGPLTSRSGFVTRIPSSNDLVAYLADEDYNALDTADLSRATAHARRQAHAYLEVIRSLPGCADAYLVSTADLGTRQSRHIVSRHPLSGHHVLSGTTSPDTVAVGTWPPEYHPGAGRPAQWAFIGGTGSYDIPLGLLQSQNTDNLFAAGRLLDADQQASASLRVMGTAFATGHAAGVAAALSAHRREMTGTAVRHELLLQGAQLPDPM